MFHKIQPAVVLVAIALMISAIACAPAPAPVPTAAPPTAAPAAPTTAPAPVATSAPAPTTAAAAPSAADILAAAKKEGKVMIYSSLNAEEFDKIHPAFTKKYPDIKVEYYRGDSESVTQKALTEFRANNHVADLVETTDTNIVQLISTGVTGKYLSTETKAYPASAYDPEGGYAAGRVNLIVIAYNTNLVKKEDAPKKLEDLLDPKWAGKIAIEFDDWPMMAYTAKAMGEAKSNEFWTKLAAQKPRVVKGHTELANFLVAGEFAISPHVYAHRVLSLQDRKAPIEMVKSDTVYAFPHMMAVTKNAPHPNAAKVWMDWWLSLEGQQALVDAGRIPARPGVKTKPEGVLEGFANIFYGDPQSLLKAGDVQKKYYDLFGIK